MDRTAEGPDAVTYYNAILRQQHPDLPGKWVGFYLVRCALSPDGDLAIKESEHETIGVRIGCFAPSSGDFAGVAVKNYNEYAAAAPVIRA